MKPFILIIEDDPDIAESIRYNLEREGAFQTQVALSGEEGLNIALGKGQLRRVAEGANPSPDLLILDLNLPGMNGFELCRRFRTEELTRRMPIIMLTAKDDVVDKIVGLEMGADDYLTKPFSLRELEARLKTVLRRTRNRPSDNDDSDQAPIVRGDLRIDPSRREVTVAGRAIELTPKEFELLSLFASHPGRVYSRKYLLENIWDYTYGGYDRTIDSHINRLRAKIEEDPDNPKMVLTVWGVGYKFNDEY